MRLREFHWPKPIQVFDIDVKWHLNSEPDWEENDDRIKL